MLDERHPCASFILLHWPFSRAAYPISRKEGNELESWIFLSPCLGKQAPLFFFPLNFPWVFWVTPFPLSSHIHSLPVPPSSLVPLGHSSNLSLHLWMIFLYPSVLNPKLPEWCLTSEPSGFCRSCLNSWGSKGKISPDESSRTLFFRVSNGRAFGVKWYQ